MIVSSARSVEEKYRIVRGFAHIVEKMFREPKYEKGKQKIQTNDSGYYATV